MKTYEPQNIRNVVLLSHSGVGKTTLLENLLYNNKVINRLGSTADGTSQIDHLPFEMEKRFTIASKVFPVENNDVKVNFIDTPGYPDFIGEVIGSLSVAENAVLLVDASAGVQIHTTKMWDFLKEYNTSKLIFVNKLDIENASFQKSLDSIKEQLTDKTVVLQIPVGEGENFKGVIDLITMKYVKSSEGGKEPEITDIPDDMKDEVQKYHNELIESVVETDEEVMMEYLEGEVPSEQKVLELLKNGIVNDVLVPVLCGSSTKNCGINNLLDKIVSMFSSPLDRKSITLINPDNEEETEQLEVKEDGPFAGLVFKTVVEEHIGELTFIKCYSGSIKVGDEVYNPRSNSKERIGQIAMVIGKKRDDLEKLVTGDIGTLVKLKDTKVGDTLKDSSIKLNIKPINFPEPVLVNAVEADNKKEQEKLTGSLVNLAQGDPTFDVKLDKLFNQLLISGMGELQLNLMLKKVKDKLKININTKPPRIAYKETFTKKVEAQGKYKKQSGGRGQYGDCHIRIIPGKKGSDFEFENKIFGGAIPQKFIEPCKKGIYEALQRGFTAGYPIIDVKVELYDGSYHDVDSSDMAFQIAGSFAVKECCKKVKPVLLEPIMNLEVKIPESYVGDVMGDLNSRRGRVQGMDPQGGINIIKAQVPEREIPTYATDLRSLTRGQGDFKTEFSHYEQAPHDIAEKIVQEAEQLKKEED